MCMLTLNWPWICTTNRERHNYQYAHRSMCVICLEAGGSLVSLCKIHCHSSVYIKTLWQSPLSAKNAGAAYREASVFSKTLEWHKPERKHEHLQATRLWLHCYDIKSLQWCYPPVHIVLHILKTECSSSLSTHVRAAPSRDEGSEKWKLWGNKAGAMRGWVLAWSQRISLARNTATPVSISMPGCWGIVCFLLLTNLSWLFSPFVCRSRPLLEAE